MLLSRQLGSCSLRSRRFRASVLRDHRPLSVVRASSADDQEKEQLTLNYVIKQLQRSMRMDPDSIARNVEMAVAGGGRHLGINITWSIRWRPDGAFYEEINGKELCFKWGYDGGVHSSVWEMDSSGVARSLECDDHEALLVCSWVRTGCWLQPHLMHRLELELETPAASKPATASTSASQSDASPSSRRNGQGQSQNGSSSGRQRSPGRPAPSAPTQVAGTPWDAEPAGGIQVGPTGSMGSSGDDDCAPSTSEPDVVKGPVVINMRVKGGKLLTRLRVCPRKWAVQGLDQPLCGDVEVWDFARWKGWTPGVIYPEALVHQAVAGGQHVYRTESARVGTLSPISTFQIPVTPMLPADTQYDATKPAAVPVWRAGSGHLLVRPQINGQEGGLMVVDTGASGFVITPRAAVALGLDSFGELFAASISGKVPTQFVKARTWSLGPLTISAPVMMTMSLDGLVRGGPPGGEVIGIVGYDIFRRAVIELPQMSKAGNTEPAAPREDGSGSTSDDGPSISSPLPLLHTQRTGSAIGSRACNGHSGSMEAGSGSSTETDSTVSAGLAAASALSSSMSGRSSSGSGSSGGSSSGGPSSRGSSNGGGGRAPWDSSGRDSQQHTMYLHNPDNYTADADGWSWHPFRMIASLPHVEVRFLDAGGAPLDVLLMLDSGACGADIMLHARAMSELKLGRLGRPSSHFVRGVGGSVADNSVRVEMVDLPWVEVAGIRFSRVRCMYAGVGGLDISTYSAGIICGDLLGRLASVIDYSRKRIGFRLQQE